MDIREAKEQIKQAVAIYLQKDRYGAYRIPIEKQRPIFLLGAPGIGKTAIMEQIAEETGLPLVSYSMTHHTRQSALGLPIIEQKTYQGEQFQISSYTLSEIIATLYETMEKTGKQEGILFLDEINCVSETLAPSMLQFLQYKVFGNHRIPEGWVIVTAGNPPAYNRAVREFDVVTLDRLKVMEIEPDFAAWLQYARESGVHHAIISYLDIRRDAFYRIENSRTGREYVTARGWEDLSEAILLYEEQGFKVDEALISQYIRHSRIADEFTTYYALYCKYRGEYPLRQILKGAAGEDIDRQVRKAALDERITVLELLLEAMLPEIRDLMAEEAGIHLVQEILKKGKTEEDFIAYAEEERNRRKSERKVEDAAGTLNFRKREASLYAESFLYDRIRELHTGHVRPEEAFQRVKDVYREAVDAHLQKMEQWGKELSELFAFVIRNWGDSQELVILLTELTANPHSMAYLYEYGNDAYDRYSDRIRLSDRSRQLEEEVQAYLDGSGEKE